MTTPTPDPIETADIGGLRTLQLDRLRWTLRHTYEHVQHFRDKCDAARVDPSDLRELSDLQHFPFTTKEDFRTNYPFGLFAVPLDRVVRLHASSGTTGKPTVVGYTRRDIGTWAEVCARSIRAGGGKAGDKVHVAFGYGLFTGGLGAHYGAERLGAMVIPVSGGQTKRQIQLIEDFRPDIIMSTPSYMLTIADEFEKKGLDPAKSSIRIGIFGAEPWSEAMRAELERRCGLRAVDLYGLSEVIGPGVATECSATEDGLTIWEDHFYPEVIDPHTGEVLPEGQMGELVLTSLTKEALPVIRFRTHDLTRLLPGTVGAMRRMTRVTGRSDDMLIIRGVNLFPSQIEEQVLKQKGLSPHYQLIVSRLGQLDYLTVRVERQPHIPEERSRALAEALRRDVRSYVGISVQVEVDGPGRVPRSEGKAVRVIDRRSQLRRQA